MNIYVSTKGSMVGYVLTGYHNQPYVFKAFRTDTTDKQAQITLATQRAVAFAHNNKVKCADHKINLYTQETVDVNKIAVNEYLSRYDYPIVQKDVRTDEEKQRMLLAETTIVMEMRRQAFRKEYSR